ncbi:MAG TPA: hypothetical protein VF741_09595 [Candidatus Aquilonibacter sp.]
MKLSALLLAAATIVTTTNAQFTALVAQMQRERATKQWEAYRKSAFDLSEILNQSPDTMIEVARADVHLGNRDTALKNLFFYSAMGGGDPAVLLLPDFAPLRSTRQFANIMQAVRTNAQPVNTATTAFTLSDPGLLPENIDYDPSRARFFITSVRRGEIVTSDRGGRLTVFARAPDRWPMLGLKIDAARGIVWSTEVAIDGFTAVPKRDWGRSVVLGYDLRSGNLIRRVEGPRGCAFNDLTVDADGNVLVGDANGGGIYRLARNSATLRAVNMRDFISPLGAAYTPDGRLYIADYTRGIGIMNANGDVRWIPMAATYALAGTDGLYYNRGWLIAVQNGFVPERVVAFRLYGDDHVDKQRTIESGTAQLDPTHGVIVSDTFYYLKNTGWNQLDGAGNLKPGAKLTPAIVMRATL